MATTMKDCKICTQSAGGWGSLTLSDSAGICKDCMNLIRSMDKNTGPAEGLQKKIDHWDKKNREIEMAQAINLAQNHVLKFTGARNLGDAKITINQIKKIYPDYLELLMRAKGQLKNNNDT